LKFQNVSLLSIGYTLPSEVLTSDQIETRLSPVYERLKLPAGRLEGMSGIRERRLWKPRSRLSDQSIQSVRNSLDSANFDPSLVGCLIHASVCREYLEPATACRVHHFTGLSSRAWVYDVSNACLGIMNGAVQIAQLIEAGAIEAGIVVGTEDCRGLLEATLAQLLGDATLTRQSIKPAFASLTIGSGSCAWLLGRRDRFGGSPVHAAVAVARTEHHHLCQSDTDQAGSSMQPIMNTDSEMLLEAGIATGAETFEHLLAEWGWSRQEIQYTVCHQVGTAHRRRMLGAMSMPEETDYFTFDRMGNTGSVALPTALGESLVDGFLKPASRVGLLGIGSGLNSVMIGIQYEQLPVERTLEL
jgi:acyl-CoA:acyl-CoA alkyltransferase